MTQPQLTALERELLGYVEQLTKSSTQSARAMRDLEKRSTLTAHLSRRSITCAMRLDATQDRKTNKAQINWLTKQLAKTNDEFMYVRAWHKNSPQAEQVPLNVAKEEPETLIADGKDKILFSRFEVATIRDLAGKFSGSKTFIQNLEEIAPAFYEEAGQYLRAWVKPAPKPHSKEMELETLSAD